MNMFKHFDVIIKSDKESDRKSAILSIVNECSSKDSAEATKSFEYAVKRFVKGMQSTNESTRVEFFTGLVTLLKLLEGASADTIIELLEKSLTRNETLSKQEKRMMYVARILAYGAVLKSRSQSNGVLSVDVVQRCVHNIAEVAKQKNFYCSLGMPFIRYAMDLVATNLNPELRTEISGLMVKQDKPKLNLEYMTLALAADVKGISPPLGEISGVEEIIDILIAAVDVDDKERLDLIFEYLKTKDLYEEFWNLIVSKTGPYDSKIFCTCVSHAISSGCPIQYVLTEEVVHMLLSSLHTRELGKDIRCKAILSLQKLADWRETSMTSKERKKCLKVLYKKTPNLLHEYQTLVGVIKMNFSYLTAKELSYLGDHFKEIIGSAEEDNTMRNRLSALALLRHAMQARNATPEVQVSAASYFFKLGLCDDTAVVKHENADLLAAIQVQAASNFVTSIRKTLNSDFVDALYEEVRVIVEEETEETKLRLKPAKEVLDMWKRTQKLIPKIKDPTASVITKVGAMGLVAGEFSIVDLFDGWLESVKLDSKKGKKLDVALFIVNEATGIETPFFNHEVVFKNLARSDNISEEAVQAMADAIDIPEEGDDDDGDDEDDEEEDSDSDSEKPSSDADKLAVQVFSNLKAGADEDEESDATVDMDDATEEELKKMDEALAGVFSTKKQMKDASRIANIRYMRMLNLIDILLGRHKDLAISIYLILLMPLVTALKHYLTIKASQNHNAMKKTLSTLRRLSKFKKFADMTEVQKNVLEAMASEIRALMKKKFINKDAKNVLFACVQTLEGNGNADVQNGIGHKQKKSKNKGKTVHSNNSKVGTAERPENKQDTSEQVNGIKASKDLQSSAGVKRKAQRGLEKKKAKLLRMAVLNEGLTNVEVE